MSRRLSQSLQQSQKSQSIRPNALAGLDGVLNTLEPFARQAQNMVGQPGWAKPKTIDQISGQLGIVNLLNHTPTWSFFT